MSYINSNSIPFCFFVKQVNTHGCYFISSIYPYERISHFDPHYSYECSWGDPDLHVGGGHGGDIHQGGGGAGGHGGQDCPLLRTSVISCYQPRDNFSINNSLIGSI